MIRERDRSGTLRRYSQDVIGGKAASVTVARDITSFHTAVPEKFVTEIAQVSAQSRSG